ncbi:hypothetical protein [Mycolicibacterium neoaurum]|uniref:hypothetical protein n=1 Tax=Mycolicibacterium neoaurum TaxID=1795 RepID=UPI001F4C65F5|nr:hypothetical protein [Mycolicibacterium neoaurum]
MAIPLVLSQLAGIAGFLLSLANRRDARQLREDAKNAPRRADQRRHREALREVVHAAKKECDGAEACLRTGSDLMQDIPNDISIASSELEKLMLVLKDPDSGSTHHLKALIEAVESDWRYLNRIKKDIDLTNEFKRSIGDQPMPNDRLIRRRTAAEMELRDSINRFSEEAVKVIALTIALDELT